MTLLSRQFFEVEVDEALLGEVEQQVKEMLGRFFTFIIGTMRMTLGTMTFTKSFRFGSNEDHTGSCLHAILRKLARVPAVHQNVPKTMSFLQKLPKRLDDDDMQVQTF